MINRILIRVKVVQILYSYLLSRSEFQIDMPPENASRDRKFGYAVYLDALTLIQELSGIKTNHPSRELNAFNIDPHLRANRVGRVLSENPMLREITFKNSGNLNILGPIMNELSDFITSQTAFIDYTKRKKHSLDEDITLWCVLIESIFLHNQQTMAALRKSDDFSLTGLHYGVMQAVDTLKAYNDSRAMYIKAKNELAASLDKAYELYMSIFVLMAEITQEEADRQQMAKEKHLATASDLNPNTRMVDNAFIRTITERADYKQFVDRTKFTWIDAPGVIDKILEEITSSELYETYMNRPSTSWQDDCEFWRDVLRTIILPSEALDTAIEGKSIYWNDDLPTIGTFVAKTIRRFGSVENGTGVEFLPQFKDEEDENFGATLFTLAVENREEYRTLIDQFITSEWEPDRLAFMDIIIMTVAIAEIINFPAIPLPVTFNEYIEIANNYSTRRSGPFINGILYSVSKHLIETGKIYKHLASKE